MIDHDLLAELLEHRRLPLVDSGLIHRLLGLDRTGHGDVVIERFPCLMFDLELDRCGKLRGLQRRQPAPLVERVRELGVKDFIRFVADFLAPRHVNEVVRPPHISVLDFHALACEVKELLRDLASLEIQQDKELSRADLREPELRPECRLALGAIDRVEDTYDFMVSRQVLCLTTGKASTDDEGDTGKVLGPALAGWIEGCTLGQGIVEGGLGK